MILSEMFTFSFHMSLLALSDFFCFCIKAKAAVFRALRVFGRARFGCSFFRAFSAAAGSSSRFSLARSLSRCVVARRAAGQKDSRSFFRSLSAFSRRHPAWDAASSVLDPSRRRFAERFRNRGRAAVGAWGDWVESRRRCRNFLQRANDGRRRRWGCGGDHFDPGRAAVGGPDGYDLHRAFAPGPSVRSWRFRCFRRGAGGLFLAHFWLPFFLAL